MLTFNTYTILRYYTSFVFRTSLVRSHVDFGVDDQKCNFFEKENRITKLSFYIFQRHTVKFLKYC